MAKFSKDSTRRQWETPSSDGILGFFCTDMANIRSVPLVSANPLPGSKNEKFQKSLDSANHLWIQWHELP